MSFWDILFDGFFAAVAGTGFGAISDPPVKAFPRIALLAAIGHALRFAMMKCGTDIGTASFVAAFVIGSGSLILARQIRVPMTILYIPALLPMIPGTLAGLLAGSYDIGYYVWFLGVWVMIALMLVGPANPHNANDNTSGVITLLEIARSLPESQREKVCFVLFDLEEAGLIGSAAYRKAHKKASDGQLVLNLDCVGDGDHIRFFPTKKLKKDRKKLTSLYKACGYFGKKNALVQEKGFSVYPSDQANFPYGVGICALRKKGKTLYLSRIHTPKDTILEETNVNILRAALITFITCGAAQ